MSTNLKNMKKNELRGLDENEKRNASLKNKILNLAIMI